MHKGRKMMKSKKKKRKLRLIAVLVLIGVGLLLGGYLYINSLTYKTCYAEAGVAVSYTHLTLPTRSTV